MTALQVLNSHNRTLAETQNRISMGFKVSSAKDSGSIYAIAQGMRANTAAWGAVNQSLLHAQGILDIAVSAAASVTDILMDTDADVHIGMSGTDLDGTGLSYTNGHYIDQSTTLLYGDHSEFSVRPPSDVRFNAV